MARVKPGLLAGLLYIGAGAGLTLWRLVRASREAPICRRDLPRVALVGFFGSFLGPLLLLRALAAGEAAAVALLLNLEAPFTAILARLFYGETVERSGLGAAVLVAAVGIVLAWPGRRRTRPAAARRRRRAAADRAANHPLNNAADHRAERP